MAKAKRSKAVDVHKIAAGKKHTPTSARMMKLRPHDAEPLEKAAVPEEKPEAAESEKKKPRQSRLPGIQDPEIESLETLAEDYASVRDQRQALTKDEVDLKQKLLSEMQGLNRETYNHDGIEIRVIHKDTTVRVKIRKDDED